MAEESPQHPKAKTQEGLDILIRFGLIVVLVVLCDRVLGPFWHILAWALILAVGLSPLHQSIAARMNNNQGRSSTLLVVGLLLVLGAPIAILTSSFGGGVFEFKNQIDNENLVIPPPE